MRLASSPTRRGRLAVRDTSRNSVPAALRASPQRRIYEQIHINTLRVNSVLPFRLFTKIEGEHILYRRENLPFTQNQRQALVENDIQFLFILGTELELYWLYLTDSIQRIIESQDDPLEDRASIFYSSSLELSRRVYQTALPGEGAIGQVQGLMHTHVAFLESKSYLHRLMPSMEERPSLYSHALNVAQYGLMLARALGYQDEAELEAIGMGFFLQDYGMLQIPASLVFKEGPLSFEEWTAVKRHPAAGVEAIDRIPDVPEVTRSIVFSHHERLDGSGYPQGLSGDELSLPVKIAGLVDVFASLTTSRSYRPAHTAFQALELMASDVGRLYDRSVFTCLVRTLGE